MLRPHLRPQYQPLCRANKYDFEYLLSKDLPGAMKAASDASRLCNDLVAKQTGNPSKEPGHHYQGTNLRKANGPQWDFRQMPPRRHQRAPPSNSNGRNHGKQTGARRGGLIKLLKQTLNRLKLVGIDGILSCTSTLQGGNTQADGVFKDHNLDGEDVLVFKQWVHTDRTSLVTIQETVNGYIDKLCMAVQDLAPHHYIAKSQTSYKLETSERNHPRK